MWYTVATQTGSTCEVAPIQNIKRPIAQVGHTLVLFSVLTLAWFGQLPDSQAGWVTCPLPLAGFSCRQLARGQPLKPPLLRARLCCCWHYLRHGWRAPLARSVLLAGLWLTSGRQGPGWVVLVPWLRLVSQAVRVGWPEFGHWGCWLLAEEALWQGQRLLVESYALLVLWTVGRSGRFPLCGLGCLLCGREEPWVQVTRQADGRYRAELCGHFAHAGRYRPVPRAAAVAVLAAVGGAGRDPRQPAHAR